MNVFLRFFEGLKINTKLVLGLGFMLTLVVVIGLQTVYSIRQQGAQIERMYEFELRGVSQIKEANIHLMEIGRSIRQMILAPDAVSQVLARAALEDARERLRYALAESDKVFVRPEGRKMLSDIQHLLTKYQRNVDHILALLDKTPNDHGNEIIRFLASSENVKVFESTDKLMASLVRHKEHVAHQAELESLEFSKLIERWTVGLLLLGIVAGLGAGLLLGVSLRRPLERLRESIERLAQGQLDLVVPHTDFKNEVGDMARSVVVLQQGALMAEVQRWVKSCAFNLGQSVQAIEDVGEFARVIMSQLTPLVGAQAGLLYVLDKKAGGYGLQGGWGVADAPSLIPFFRLDEGLIGQCARDGKPIFVNDVPVSGLRICSGLLNATPRWVRVLPVCNLSGDVLAVMELASVNPLHERVQGLFDDVVPLLALNLEILERNQIAHKLLLQTQDQAQELHAQQAQFLNSRERA